jgi:hypothetical protein
MGAPHLNDTPGSRTQARVNARPSVTSRPTGFLDPPAPQARAVNRRAVAILPKTKAIERSASHLGLNPLSLEAMEEVLNKVACQESTQTEDFALKAKKTEVEPARCRAVLNQARSSISHAFVHTQQEETKKGAASWKSAPSRKTHQVLHVID